MTVKGLEMKGALSPQVQDLIRIATAFPAFLIIEAVIISAVQGRRLVEGEHTEQQLGDFPDTTL